jgi:NAD(P)-dependent dehydrogenase (short-subunit alcohol dehydrogenase family)
MTDQPVCVITGPTHGIGRVTAQAMAVRGYRVVLACRNEPLGETMATRLGHHASAVACDLGDPANIERAAGRILEGCDRLDVLVNNAGAMLLDNRRIDALDAMMAVNHLGHFHLTRRLMPLIEATPGCRVVVVASAAHRSARLSLDDPLAVRQPAGGFAAYGRSKLANVLFALALARRLEGTGRTCNALHPGVVYSNFMSAAGGWLALFGPLIRPFVMDEQRGAATTVHVATAPELNEVNGAYFDARIVPSSPASLARDVELQERLWVASEAAVAATSSPSA